MIYLFIIYLGIGLIFSFAPLLVRKRTKNTGTYLTSRDKVAEAARTANRRSRLHSIASVIRPIETILRSVSSAAVWPTSTFTAIANYKTLNRLKEEIGSKRYLATVTELAHSYASSVFALSVVVLTYAVLCTSDPNSQLARLVLLLMISHVLFRHASYNLSLILLEKIGYPEFLPSFFAELRQRYSHPYVVFLFIILLDLGTYLIAFDGVINSAKLMPIEFGRITTLYNEIFQYKGLGDLIEAGTLSPEEYLVAISGLVFSLSLLSSLINFSQFKRTAEDHLVIAERKNVIGANDAALRELKKIDPHQRTRHVFEVEAAAYLSMGKPPKAIQSIKNLLTLEGRDAAPGQLFPSLFDVAHMSELEASRYFPVLKAAIREEDIPDYALFFCVETFGIVVELDRKKIGKLYEKLREFAEPSKYPLSLAFLRLLSGNSTDQSSIPSLPDSATAYERYLHNRLLQWTKDEAGINQKVIDEWFKKDAPKIIRSVEHMEFDYQKAGAILQTVMTAKLRSENLGEARDFADLIDKAIESIGDDGTRSFLVGRLKQASRIKSI